MMQDTLTMIDVTELVNLYVSRGPKLIASSRSYSVFGVRHGHGWRCGVLIPTATGYADQRITMRGFNIRSSARQHAPRESRLA